MPKMSSATTTGPSFLRPKTMSALASASPRTVTPRRYQLKLQMGYKRTSQSWSTHGVKHTLDAPVIHIPLNQ